MSDFITHSIEEIEGKVYEIRATLDGYNRHERSMILAAVNEK